MWSVPGVTAPTKARPERLETLSHRSAAIGVPLLVTVPSAGRSEERRVGKNRYSGRAPPATRQKMLSGTDCPAATVWLVAVTTGAGIGGWVIVSCEVFLQTPL